MTIDPHEETIDQDEVLRQVCGLTLSPEVSLTPVYTDLLQNLGSMINGRVRRSDMVLFGVIFPLWTIVKTVLILWLISEIYDWLKILAWRRKFKLTGPFPLPLVGTFPAFIIAKRKAAKARTNSEGIAGDQQEGATDFELPPCTAGNLGPAKMLTVKDVELAKKIFIKDHVHFQNTFTMEGLNPHPLDKMISVLKDSEWKRVRNVLSPTYSSSKLKKMAPEINYSARCLVAGLLEQAKNGEPVNVKRHFGCFGLDAIASTAFGVRTDTYSNPDDPFTSVAEKALDDILNNHWIILALFFPNLARVIRICFKRSLLFSDSAKFWCDSIRRIIEERKEKNDTERTDMLQLMLNAQRQGESEDGNQGDKNISEDEIIAQACVAFLAGYLTTALLLSFVSYNLATHPDVQDKLIEEIDEKVPADAAEISYAIAMEMPYLDCVINETLRMYPPGVLLQRMTSQNKDVEIDGHWFTGDTMITFNIWHLHHNPKYYPDPYKFKPERFTPAEKAKRDPFVFAPFSHGPRNCIGMRQALLEAKIATISMLRKMKFVKCEETEVPLKVKSDALVVPERPIKLGIEVR